MPIGETLAQARRQAGLTVAEVSLQTRIRETIIRKIEEDDYSECGGDFYARGHIRAIAKVVGADPEPLIQEYDARHRAPGAAGTVSLDELLATSARAGHWHRPGRPAARATAPGPPPWRQASPDAAGKGVASGYRGRRRTANWAVFVGLALAVVALGFVALPLLAGGPREAAPSAAGTQAATGHSAGRGGPSPAAKASYPAVLPSPAPKAATSQAPSPAPVQQARSLAPARATAFGPNGGDNPQLAHLVLGRRHAGWHSDWYTSARFGNLYPGTGLLLNMGRTVTITGARINLGNTTGATLQLRVGSRPALAHLRAVARASGAGGVVRRHLSHPARGRYVLVWFTKLPRNASGAFQAHVHHVSLQGHR